jgi:hypothetical protein
MGRGRGHTPTEALIKPALRSRPRPRQRPGVGREAAQLQQKLRLFDRLMDLAADEDDDKKALELEDLAWAQMAEADPIRIIHAGQLLDVSENTVREWADRGVLSEVEGSPRRVSLDSVLRAKEIVADRSTFA